MCQACTKRALIDRTKTSSTYGVDFSPMNWLTNMSPISVDVYGLRKIMMAGIVNTEFPELAQTRLNYCRAPHEVVVAYKARKERETHLALVQEESPLAPPAAPVMISTPPHAPIVATSVVPIAAALAVSNEADVAKMVTIEEGITSVEIQAEVNGFFAEST
ncbi:hypothetical protein D1007_50029 [Hordeum vulgare]|nr:hypothetical protein D1007_50029 [Hordeum vulgare]